MGCNYWALFLGRTIGLSRTNLKIYRFLIKFFYSKFDKEINEWFNSKKIFFIVSTGRTGTKWLSALLNHAVGHLVTHEPVPEEAKAHRAVCENPKSAGPHLLFRKREIYSRCKLFPELCGYGEVNGNLRRHIIEMPEILPHCTVIHIVRDGRDVIRSAMGRTVFTNTHPVYNDSFIQPTNELSTERWFQMSRFEKLCWVWRSENKYMRLNTPFQARFEDIISSYGFFKEQILEPLGLELEEAIWVASRQRQLNETKTFTMGAWENWAPEQQKKFIRICGEEMQKYGYEISG